MVMEFCNNCMKYHGRGMCKNTGVFRNPGNSSQEREYNRKCNTELLKSLNEEDDTAEGALKAFKTIIDNFDPYKNSVAK